MVKTDKDLSISNITAGNSCIYFCFATFNLLTLIVSIAIIACDIYMFVICKGANVINIFFAILGVCLLLLSTCACYLRKSVNLLACYLFIQVALFGCMFIITMILMLNKKMVEDWATTAWNKAKKDNPNIDSLDKYKQTLMDNIDIL